MWGGILWFLRFTISLSGFGVNIFLDWENVLGVFPLFLVTGKALQGWGVCVSQVHKRLGEMARAASWADTSTYCNTITVLLSAHNSVPAWVAVSFLWWVHLRSVLLESLKNRIQYYQLSSLSCPSDPQNAFIFQQEACAPGQQLPISCPPQSREPPSTLCFSQSCL